MGTSSQDPVFKSLEDLDWDIEYKIKEFWYLHGNCGYFYRIVFNKHNEAANFYFAIITEGILFDRLEAHRIGNLTSKIKFKNASIKTNDTTTSTQHIVIDGFNMGATALTS